PRYRLELPDAAPGRRMAAARQGRTCPGPFARGRTGPHLDRLRALPPLQPAQRAAVLRGRTARQGSRTDRVHGRHRYRLRRAYRTTGRPARHTQAHPSGPGAPARRAGYQCLPERTGGFGAHEPLPADPHLPHGHRHDAACLAVEPAREPGPRTDPQRRRHRGSGPAAGLCRPGAFPAGVQGPHGRHAGPLPGLTPRLPAIFFNTGRVRIGTLRHNTLVPRMQQFLIIAAAHFLALLSPGPDFFLIARTSLSSGWRVASGACAGIALANGVFIAAAFAGTAALRPDGVLFTALQAAGCAYLLY